jgi:hypothetical protein
MTIRSVHILSEEGDAVPSTGDPVVVLSVPEPALFSAAYPAQVLTPAQVRAFKTVHAILSRTDEDVEDATK